MREKYSSQRERNMWDPSRISFSMINMFGLFMRFIYIEICSTLLVPFIARLIFYEFGIHEKLMWVFSAILPYKSIQTLYVWILNLVFILATCLKFFQRTYNIVWVQAVEFITVVQEFYENFFHLSEAIELYEFWKVFRYSQQKDFCIRKFQ